MICSQTQRLVLSSEPKDQRMLQKVIKQICEQVLSLSTTEEQKPGIYTKKVLRKYLNIFVFQIGCEIPNDQEVNLLYSYLQDTKEQGIPKNKFQRLVKECMLLYAESKKTSMGGIFQRLLLQIRTYMLQEEA